MRTLGVDLASQPSKTGVAVIAWGATAELLELAVGADDDALLDRAARCDAIGIDAPFGWPEAFEALLAGASPEAWTDAARDRLRFRRTDFAVRAAHGRWPLSVSSDLIAVPALRCRGLLHRLGVTDRSGDGRVFETYPALALARWGLPSRGYKGRDRRAARRELLDALRDRAPWLALSDAQGELLELHDDALDALVAALIARAAALGRVAPIPDADRAAAATEGWIVIPDADALDALP